MICHAWKEYAENDNEENVQRILKTFEEQIEKNENLMIQWKEQYEESKLEW